MLRVLWRGVTFDDIEELSNVSAETHRTFYHKFVKLFSNHLYKEWIYGPRNVEELRSSMAEYELAGK